MTTTSSSNGTSVLSDPGSTSKKTTVPTMITRWEGIISSPMEENDASIFLHSLSQALDAHFLPTKRHFHLLLYLCATSPLAPFAQRTLAQLLALYPPASLAKMMPSPSEQNGITIPLSRDQDPDQLPAWFKWPEHPLSRSSGEEPQPLRGLNRDAMRFISRGVGRNGGIWALLDGAQVRGSVQNRKTKAEDELRGAMSNMADRRLKPAKGKKRKSAARNEDDDQGAGVLEEEEEEGQVGKAEVREVICENGWVMLGLFVKLWKADQAEHMAQEPNEPWSPLFLSQLPHPYADLPRDDASRLFRILKAGLAHVDPNTPEGKQKLDTSRALLSLLTALCTSPTPKFHAPSFIIALIDLFRHLSPSALVTGFSLISSSSTLYPHLLTLIVEDLAGVRAQKTKDRKSAEALRRDLIVNWAKGGREGRRFPPPTMGYVRELLLLQPAGKGGPAEKMRWAKGQVVVWAGVHYGPGAEWAFGTDPEWVRKFGKEEVNLDIIQRLAGA